MSRSYFKTALEVLSYFEDNVVNNEKICAILNLDSVRFDEICVSLVKWELIKTYGSHHTLTEKGRNVLSYYRATETFFDVDLKPLQKLHEIRTRISELRE